MVNHVPQKNQNHGLTIFPRLTITDARLGDLNGLTFFPRLTITDTRLGDDDVHPNTVKV